MDKIEKLAKIIKEYKINEIHFEDKEVKVSLIKESRTRSEVDTSLIKYGNQNEIENLKKGFINVEVDDENKEIKKSSTKDNNNTNDYTYLDGYKNINDNSIEDAFSIDNKNEEYKKEYIKSPLAGVFYSRNEPKAMPYIKVGDEVKAGKVICIVETMKIMNEIEAQNAFKLLKVLKKDGDIVEFDENIFEVEYV